MDKAGIFIIAVIIALTAACNKGPTPEEKAAEESQKAEPKYDNSIKDTEGIKNAIRGYNQAVINGNMKQDYLRFLRKYATEYEASRVVVFVTEDRIKKRIMRSKLSKLFFDNISSSNDGAVVKTKEEWEFDYVDSDTGKLKEPLRTIAYKLRYVLIWENNGWLVAKLEQLERPEVTTYSPPMPFTP